MMDALLAADGAVLLWMQECLRCALLDPILSVYTKLGDMGMLWIACSLLLLCFRPTRRAGLLALAAIVLGAVCSNLILKHLFARVRPWLTVPGLTALVFEGDPNSFPSGHTCAAFSAAGAWRYTLPSRWMKILALVLAALMGFSRLYVGVHFPSDVLAGAVVGLFCAWAVWKLEPHAWDRLKSWKDAK